MKEITTERPHSGNGTTTIDETALVTTDDPVTAISQPSEQVDYASFDETEFTTKRKRRRWLWFALAAAALLAAVVAFFIFRSSKSVPIATVQRGTIVSSVQTTGKLQAEQQASLSFKQSGRIESVRVKEGDTVKVGDVLAALDTSTLHRQLNEANTQLQISKLRLDQAKEGPQPADIAVATANLNGALSRLNQARSGGRAEDVASAQALLNQAQSKLDVLKKGSSALDISGAQAKVDQAKANQSFAVTSAANAKEQARLLLQEAQKASNNGTGTQGKLDQAKSNYDAAKAAEISQVNAANAAVREADAALSKLKAGASVDDIKQAEAGVSQATANLAKVTSGATSDEVAQAQSQVDAAQASIDRVKAGPTTTDLAILEQNIALAQLSVDNATSQLADSQLVSPLAGTVLSINLDVGEVIGGMQQVATVADTGLLRIEADIDEIDVGRVRAGQPVTVTLDAYPGVAMPGKIETLSPGASQKQGSTVYGARISFTPPSSVVPRTGMAANVDITAQRKDNVLILPNRALETVGTRQYVTLKGGSEGNRKVEVETGLSNTTDTEVVNGLKDGDVVVTK